MPKGQTPKLKVSICNVPIDTNDVTNILPRGADSNGIIMIKLKRKLKLLISRKRCFLNFQHVVLLTV